MTDGVVQRRHAARLNVRLSDGVLCVCDRDPIVLHLVHVVEGGEQDRRRDVVALVCSGELLKVRPDSFKHCITETAHRP